MDLVITPDRQTSSAGESVDYTLTINNYESLQHTHELSALGLAQVSLPPPVTVDARGTAALPALVEVPQGGVYQVSATAQSGQAQDSAAATLTVNFASEPPRLYLPVIMRSN